LKKEPEDLIKVYTAHGEMEAQVIRGLLESCGIRSLMQGNAALSMQPFVMDGMGEIKIMVTEAQADEARKIIEANADV
jgi:Putative prokaryotic signal transducing protein